jgi:hypothetical protein
MNYTRITNGIEEIGQRPENIFEVLVLTVYGLMVGHSKNVSSTFAQKPNSSTMLNLQLSAPTIAKPMCVRTFS